jgi:16S rRNA (guanine966-N2)-methyltransferase
MFDILLHAPWGGAEWLRGVLVLDVFAGTGALGLEAVSRGAAGVTFLEHDRAALAAIKANVAACKAGDVARVVAADALRPPAGLAHGLVFMDPPYGKDLVPAGLAALRQAGWFADGAMVVAELGPGDLFALPPEGVLAERRHGKARLVFFRV